MNAAQWAALVYTAAAESNGGDVAGGNYFDTWVFLAQAVGLLIMLGAALFVFLFIRRRR